MGGNVAPNFLCAKLIYKFLTYRFGREVGRSARKADLKVRTTTVRDS